MDKTSKQNPNDILFVDFIHYLKNRSGHDFIYHKCLRKVILDSQFQYLGFISEECTLSDIPLDYKKRFKKLPKPHSLQHKPLRFVKRLLDFVGIYKETKQVKKRIFFIENFGKLEFLALCLATYLCSRPTDYLWVLHRYALPNNRNSFNRVLNRLLYRKLGSRLRFLTDSEKVRDTFRGERFNAHVLPIPHTRHVVCSTMDKEKIICWWPGPPRENKGREDIHRLTNTLDKRAKDFILIAAKSSNLLTTSNYLSVKLIEDELTEEAYTEQLGQCDIVLLPYDPVSYSGNTSGIFVEAVTAGKTPFVKEGSWLADELKRFDLHELIIGWNSPDIFSHIYSLYHKESMRKKLYQMQTEYSKYHCLSNFREKMQFHLRDTVF